MSDPTARTIRLVKAQAIRDAGAEVLKSCYDAPQTTFERNYNFATRDAVSRLNELAKELEEQ